MNGIIERIKDTVKKHDLIQPGDSIVVGFSGGPDSTCLLHSMYLLKDYFGIDKIAAVHINHMYRGEAAFSDERFSEEFCRERNVEFHAYHYAVEEMAKEMKMSTEEVGRKVRYDAFAEIAEKLGGAKIAVAHNRQDQAETLLMRLARGTGTEGLCGIEYSRDGGIIRPLLDCSRDDIERFCEDEKLNPCIDATNLEPIYTRNVVRLNLIPYINEEMGCDIVDSLASLSDIAKEDKDFIGGFVEAAVGGFVSEDEYRGYLKYDEVEKLHPAVRKRVIMRCFERIGLVQDIGRAHLEAAEKLIASDKTTGQADFPHMYVLKRRYDRLYFEKIHNNNTNEYTLECRIIEKDAEEYVKACEIPDRRKEGCQYFDKDKVEAEGTPVLRYRRAGDMISPKGFKGTKKLKDYFIDRKIDRDLRDSIPLVCVGSTVLWIYGYEINEKFIPKDDTSCMIEMSITNV